MLHFFFVVVSAMLYKNSGRRRFSGGVFRNINIHRKGMTGFGFNGNVPDGRFAGVRL